MEPGQSEILIEIPIGNYRCEIGTNPIGNPIVWAIGTQLHIAKPIQYPIETQWPIGNLIQNLIDERMKEISDLKSQILCSGIPLIFVRSATLLLVGRPSFGSGFFDRN